VKKFDFNFKLVLGSQVISLFGGSTLQFAIILFLTRMASDELFGIIIAISQVPLILFTPLGGILADRFNKKVLIVILDTAKAMTCFLLFLTFIFEINSMPVITILLFIAMTIMALFTPVLTSALPIIVDEDVLVEANGTLATIGGSAFLVGSIIASILTPIIGTSNLILICGFLFCFSVVIDLFIKIPVIDQEKMTSMIGDIKESWRYLKAENPKILKLSLLFAMIFLLFQPAIVQISPIVVRLLEGDYFLVGVANSIAGFGLILGAMLAGKLKKWMRVGLLPNIMLIFGIGSLFLALFLHPRIVYIGFWLPFLSFSITLALIMAFIQLVNVMINVIMQKETPSHLLGKVDSLFRVVVNIATPIGIFFFGLALGAVNGRFDIVFAGVAVICLILVFLSKIMFKSVSEVAESKE